MRVCIIGCVHGNLSMAFKSAQKLKPPPELVIMCGDIQACRSKKDMLSMSVPEKYRQMGDFHQYYKGEKRAPYLTIVVGGNHEASNYFSKLGQGGWIARKMYYLGNQGLVKVGDLLVAGLSGIYFGPHKDLPRNEAEQFADNFKEACKGEARFSSYHVREVEVNELMGIPPNEVDIMVTHDWPAGIEKFGNVNSLLKRKPFFKNDIANGKLGNPLTFKLLEHMKPQYWVSAHLHVKFQAKFENTTFLALDKVLRGRSYMEVLDIKPRGSQLPAKQLKPNRTNNKPSPKDVLHTA